MQRAQGQPFSLGQPHPSDFPLLTAALSVLPELFLSLSSPSVNHALSLPVPPTILGTSHVVVTLTSAVQPHEDRTYACYISSCRRRLREQERLVCAACKALFYCSKECQKKDWKSGHKQICPRAKACMAREVKEDLPAFTFPMGIRAGGMRAWLEHQGVHNKGLWRRMCACASTIPPGDLPAQEAQEDDPAGWALPSKFIPSSQDTLPLDPTSSENWGSYYSFRKLPLKSPAAVLLSLPLSIYHGLRTLSLLPTNPSSASTSLSIIVLDPVDLLDTYPLLDELRNAIDPSISLAIHLIGPKIPTALAGQTKMLDASSPFSIHFHPPIPLSDLHTNDTLGSANMVCILSKRLGQNATSSPSSSWSHVISTCLRLDRPLWITETDELAAIDSRDYLQDAIKHHPHMATLPVQLNPWRSPIYQEREEMALPTFDHGFTTGIYVSSESTPSLVK